MSVIQHIRKDVLGLTQQQLAAAVGVNQATISRWESGHDIPSALSFLRIQSTVRDTGRDWDDAWTSALFDIEREGAA